MVKKDKAQEHIKTELEVFNKSIDNLTQQRDNALKALREACKHLDIIELKSSPPQRMCANCGAEERGWDCGYQVLVVGREKDLFQHHIKNKEKLCGAPQTVFGSIVKDNGGPLYFVGQSHPNWKGAGVKSYEQLTEIK